MTPQQVAELLEHQREVSRHVANLHRAGSSKARREYLDAIPDQGIRQESGEVYATQWHRERAKSSKEGA
jgi:hypothetical protein